MGNRQRAKGSIGVHDEYRYFVAGPEKAAEVRELWAALDAQALRVQAFLREIGAEDEYIGSERHIRAVCFKAGTSDKAWRPCRGWPGSWSPNRRDARGREIAERINSLFTVDRHRRSCEIFGCGGETGMASGGLAMFFPHAQPVGEEVIVMVHSAANATPQGCTEIPRSRYYAMVEREEAQRAAPGPESPSPCPLPQGGEGAESEPTPPSASSASSAVSSSPLPGAGGGA